MSVASVLGVIATCRYGLANMLPKRDTEAIALVHTAITIALGITAFVTLALLLFRRQLTIVLGGEEMGYWLLVAPLSLLIAGINQTLSCWYNRQTRYLELSVLRVVQATTIAILSIAFGVCYLRHGGLILAWVLGQGLVAVVYIIGAKNSLRRNRPLRFRLMAQRMLMAAWRYRDFATKGLPALLVSVLAGQMLILMSFQFYGADASGRIALLERILGVFSVVVGKSLGDIYYRRISQGKTNAAFPEVLRMTKQLIGMSVAVHLPLYVFIELLFVRVFGEQWSEAVPIARRIMFVSCLSSVFAPLTILFNYYRVQGFNLIWQSAWLLSDVAVFYWAYLFQMPFEAAMTVYAVKQSLLFLIGIVWFLCYAQRAHADVLGRNSRVAYYRGSGDEDCSLRQV